MDEFTGFVLGVAGGAVLALAALYYAIKRWELTHV